MLNTHTERDAYTRRQGALSNSGRFDTHAMPHLHHQRSPSKQSRRVQDIPPIKGHPAEASSKTKSVASESTGKAKYMFLPDTSGVEATKEPHTHTPRRCSKSRQTKQKPGEEISIQMCCLIHEKIQAHTEKERETCTLQCNLGVRQCQCSKTWRTTFQPQDSDNADRAPLNSK